MNKSKLGEIIINNSKKIKKMNYELFVNIYINKLLLLNFHLNYRPILMTSPEKRKRL